MGPSEGKRHNLHMVFGFCWSVHHPAGGGGVQLLAAAGGLAGEAGGNDG